MPVPSVDVNDQVVQLLPTEQRKPLWIIFVRALASPILRLYTLFTSFMNGSVDTGYWSNLITYAAGDRVRTIDGVFESLADGNLGNAVTDTTYWLKVLDSFIGVTERVQYNGRKLTFEWALNRYFNTTFRQPDDPVTPTPSDIYITNVTPAYASFVMYPTWYGSSAMYPFTSAPHYMYDPPVYTSASTYGFIIHMPLAVYTALGATGAIRESIVRHFADRYAVTGTFYTIVTY